MNLRKLSPYSIVISRVINAPLPFVYSWWTDFREDDWKISHQRRKIKIYERTRNRLIMSLKYQSHGETATAARIVTLKPPYAWHLDWIGDEHDETGDYKLTRLAHNRTKLTVMFKVKPKTAPWANKMKVQRGIESVWDKYVAALEEAAQNARS